MKINKSYIESLKPCQNRLDNYLEHYKSFEGDLSQFLDLKNITHEDKLWVYFRSIPKQNIGPIAADFAELVLDIYERECPNDDRPRKAIEAARSGNAANAAAYSAYSAAAHAAARAAANAAAYSAYSAAAHAAAHAARSAANAAAAYSAAANAADRARSDMEHKQIEIMKKWIK